MTKRYYKNNIKLKNNTLVRNKNLLSVQLSLELRQDLQRLVSLVFVSMLLTVSRSSMVASLETVTLDN